MKNLLVTILVLVLTFHTEKANALSYDTECGGSETCNTGFPKNGRIIYWCPTNNGSEWTRIEILGMNVISMKRFETLFMEEAESNSLRGTNENSYCPSNETSHPKSIEAKSDQSNESMKAAQTSVFSSNSGGCFHTESECPSGKAINRSNSRQYSSEEEAKEAGLIKCRRCLFIEKMRLNEL